VKANGYHAVRFISPYKGRVELRVDSSAAIDIYLVQESDFGNWKSGKDYSGASYRRRKHLKLKMKIDRDVFGDEFYLVFDNPSNDPVAVDYEAFGR
jgi:hypothetical protein